MGTHDDTERGSVPLTTEDIAGPDAAGGPDAGPPVYPGEGTGQDLSGRSAGGRDEEDEGFTAGRDEEEPASASSGMPADRPDDGADDGADGAGHSGDGQPLLAAEDAERYRTAWGEIQGRFVDDPRDAVTSADTLVAEVMQDLAGTFASHKQELEGQWQRGDDVATEDLRQALQHYRSFFNRLLNA
ncbi:hypothetical protein AB0F18_38090 [Streptomyces sp. NPDC029216]|uniref:hypothetical protein n=1 Tax=Streptomyces sp. NPDC029216 TaxID=3154701 RepID=UPI0033FD6F94